MKRTLIALLLIAFSTLPFNMAAETAQGISTGQGVDCTDIVDAPRTSGKDAGEVDCSKDPDLCKGDKEVSTTKK